MIVDDPDNVFPDDFTLTVVAGANYTFEGNVVTPAEDFNGNLPVAVTVNDGTLLVNEVADRRPSWRAPALLAEFLVGKALAAGLIIALVAGSTLFLGFLYHDIAWLHFPVSLVWLVISGVALFAWFGALQMLFSNQKTAGVVSTLLVFPLLMAGGSFFPLAVMPGWIAAIGRASPNGFMADRVTTEITAATTGAIDSSSWGIVIAAAVTGLGVCAWRLRAGFARA